MSLKRATALAASAVLLGSLATIPGGTAFASSTAACTMNVGSINDAGAAVSRSVNAGPPSTTEGPGQYSWPLFSAGLARASTNWTWGLTAPQGTYYIGSVIAVSSLYTASYVWDRN